MELSTFHPSMTLNTPPVLCQAISIWLKAYKSTSLKYSSYARLETSLHLMEQYPIAYTPTNRLTSFHVQSYINSLVDDGYALTTIKKQFHLISAFVCYANAEGILPYPVHKAVKLPAQTKIKKPKREILAYTNEEQARLKTELQTYRKDGYRLIYFLLETGLRIGEALALTWDDIDFDRRAVTIRKTLVNPSSNEKSFVQNSAKSQSSNRTIPLSTEAQRILAGLPKDHTYVFSQTKEETFSYKVLNKHLTTLCKNADVPRRGFHVFRHTFATNCYYRGCDVKILSKLLGHSSVNVTYNTYINLFGDALEDMRAVLN